MDKTRSCSRCRGSGWLVKKEDNVEVVEPCPECRRKERLGLQLKSAQIPPRYFDRGFDVFSFHDASQEAALKKAIDYVEKYPDVERGVLFSGPCGVGKTHLSVAIIKALIEEKGVAARFVDEAELLRRLQYSYGPDSSDTEREVMLPLMEIGLLVWDDLGTGRPTDWVKETIRMVLNYRYTYEKPTIMTTNWPLNPPRPSQSSRGQQTLEERVGTRLFSRVMEMCEVVEVSGPDARTEIHKAGLDFSKNRGKSSPGKIPLDKIQCPICPDGEIRVLDRSQAKGSGKTRFIEMSCLCKGCSEHFLVRYFPNSGRIEYPSSL